MSDATTPANPAPAVAPTPAVLSPETPIVPTSGTKRVPGDSEAAVVQDAQQYDWGYDEDDIVDALARWYMREAYQQLLAERDALLAERDMGACPVCHMRSTSGYYRDEHDLGHVCTHAYHAAHDNAERMIRG